MIALAPSLARADDFLLDGRFVTRVGFAYSGVTRGPALSFSTGIEADILRITPRVALTVFFDADSTTRLDLPDQDPRAGLGNLGLGVGIFYVSDGNVAFGLASAPSMAFDNDDVIGVGFSTRATLYPFYVPMSEAASSSSDHFAAWVRSALSVWVLARADFTGDGNGGTLAFGVSFDLGRLMILPELAAMKSIH